MTVNIFKKKQYFIICKYMLKTKILNPVEMIHSFTLLNIK